MTTPGIMGREWLDDELAKAEDFKMGRNSLHPLPTLEWPGANPPSYWWGTDGHGNLIKVYRSYEDYCSD